MVTRPLIFTGAKLQLNVATGAGGTMQVEMLNASGAPIDRFTRADADEITGNYIRVPASWRQSADVGALAGRPVRLRFVMHDAKLYSFQFLAA